MPPHHVFCLPFACVKLWSKNSLIGEVRNAEIKENSQRRQKIMMQSLSAVSDFSSFSRAIDNILSHILRAILQILKPQVES